MKKIILGLCLLMIYSMAHATNGLENIIVEKYYVSTAADSAGSSGILPAGSVTYRIFADMLPGYNFQALYGIPGHTLLVKTSTSFFNNEDFGSTTPTASAANVRKNSALLDSYFSVGGSANGKVGVLKTEDTDGSTGNFDGILQNNDLSAGAPINIGTTTSLSAFDGMINGAPATVTFVGISAGDLSALDDISQAGNLFSTSNGSIAALGGAVGPTSSNRILIGQFTTTGVFSFQLNVQIGTPSGGVQNYVAQNASGSEISIPSLTFGPITGPSSSATPYVMPVAPGATTTSILSVPNVIGAYEMEGIPDGLGAFDNGNGTFTLLMNHELTNTGGVVRAHGSIGSFVSKWIINKGTLQVISGGDLMQNVKLWNVGTQTYDTYNSGNPSVLARFGRFCSADLPPVSAFYNSATGMGTQERIYMNGEETNDESRAMAHIVTGANTGTSWELPALGKAAWENSVASPSSGDKTVVGLTNDGTDGQVYFYIGTKTNAGTEIQKAGLTNGHPWGVIVSGFPVERVNSSTINNAPAPGTAFSLVDLGNVTNITGATFNTNSNTAGVTKFSRPEDGAWDPSNPNDFYFVTTDQFDQVSDGLGSQVGRTRLWRLRFTNIATPELGGTVEAVLDGTEGLNMLDNIAIDHYGHILLQEDVGNSAHNGKIWQYTIATDQVKQVAKHDPARFGDIGLAATAPFNQDEETSGIIDMQEILGPGMFLSSDQAHYAIAGAAVEGGQLFALFNPDTYNSNPEITIAGNAINILDGDVTPSASDNTDFGTIFAATSKDKVFRIYNIGPGNLSVTGISFSGTNASEFALVTPPSFPLSINSGDSLTITVRFTSGVVGNRTATINVASNDFDEATYDFALKGNVIPAFTGPSSSATPYVLPVAVGATSTSILTTPNVIGGYEMEGIPDGLGAFDNGDGNFTLLMNHELTNTLGVVRSHGSIGSFVSKWVINKTTLAVVSGGDLMQNVKLWNVGTQTYNTYNSGNPSVLARFGRFCSADLPPVSAFYNSATGMGTQERIYMNGEETNDESRAMAHIVTGTNAGTSWELPALGKAAWENSVASPFASNKTIVGLTNDGTDGQVYFYIGTKSNSGTEIEKAGLTNGHPWGVKVSGFSLERVNTTTINPPPTPGTHFDLIDIGNVTNITGATFNTNSNTLGVTKFSRPEDGAWDPSNSNDFYFVTTDQLDQTFDGIGGQVGRTRLWKLHFADISHPELGGNITAVLDGTEGINMLDNIAVDHHGHILLQEDVGNAAHNGKIWQYTIATDGLKLVDKHDPARFGDIGLAATAPFNQDEETSGIIDVQDVLGAGMFLTSDQAHYSLPGGAVEGGQLLALFNPDTYNSNLCSTSSTISVAGCDSVTVHGNKYTSSGVYTFSLPNASGCDSVVTANVTVYPHITVTATPASPIQCFGYTTCVNVSATGGTGIYSTGTGSLCGFGSGDYTFTVTDNFGCSATSTNVHLSEPEKVEGTVTPTNATCGNANGSAIVSATGGSGTYSGYLWNDPSAQITQTAAGLAAGSYTVTITDNNGCTGTASATVGNVGSLPGQPSAITGPPAVCKGQTGVQFSVTNVPGVTYSWTLPVGASGSSTTNSITVNFNNSYGGGTVCVSAINVCGPSAPSCLPVGVITGRPAFPAAPAGPSINVCGPTTVTYSIPAVANATFYQWTVTGTGFTIASGQGTTSITVNVSGGFSGGQVRVYSGSCSGISGENSLNVYGSLTSQPQQAIFPSIGVCGGSTYTYAVTPFNGAASITWTAPAGSVINGISNPLTTAGNVFSVAITFPVGFVSGNVSVFGSNACGNGPARTVAVRSTPAQPASITGPFTGVCGQSGVVYSTTGVNGATSYAWSLPAGVTLVNIAPNQLSITVNYTGAFSGSGSICVTPSNSCGAGSPRCLTVVCGASALQNTEQSASRSASEIAVTSELNAYPNPTTGKLSVSFSATAKEKYTLKVTDLIGRIMISQPSVAVEGVNMQEIDLSNVAKGMYLLSIEREGSETQTMRVVVE